MAGSRHTDAPRLVGRVQTIAGLFAAIVALLVFLSVMGMHLLSSVRAYVTGESLWSKSQKQAVLCLHRYALSGEEADYRAYWEHIQVPLGDRMARQALERRPPDLDAARQGFLQGGNHPEDLDRLIVLFRRFRNVRYVEESIGIWKAADRQIARLNALAAGLHDEVSSPSTDPARVEEFLTRIDDIDRRLTELEVEFSETMGSGARWLQRVVVIALLLTAVTLVSAGVFVSWLLARGMRARDRALRASEARYRTLFERTVAGVCRSTLDGRILDCNEAFARILGYSSARELLREPSADHYWDPEDRERFLTQLRRQRRLIQTEQKLTGRDGSSVWVLESAVLLDESMDGDGPSETILATIIDITDRKQAEAERERLEEQLRHSQKLEAVGRLAGGVAHDFNNLLTVIRGHTDFLLASERLDGAGRGDLEEISSAAKRAADLVRQLLAFSRKQVLHPRPLDLSRVVLDIRKMLSRVIGEDIELRTELEPDLAAVRADPVQIQQVLMNLAVNARAAMPEGGSLAIATRNIELSEASAGGPPGLEPASYVLLQVRDTGHGMGPDVQEHLFEPFFTTKKEGTGLGLATVYGIVQQSGGEIEVESAPGEGATFRIYLPAIEAEEESETGPTDGSSSPGSANGDPGTVLVVEDDPAVRRIAIRSLSRAGYRVYEAADGVRALEHVERCNGGLDLVVSDVVMPKMGGFDLADRIVALYPDLPILMMSGYTEEETGRTTRLADVFFLQKPFTPDEFIARVEEILGSGRRP